MDHELKQKQILTYQNDEVPHSDTENEKTVIKMRIESLETLPKLSLVIHFSPFKDMKMPTKMNLQKANLPLPLPKRVDHYQSHRLNR